MNMKDLIAYNAQKKKERAAKWMKEDGYNTIQGFTEREFNESIKQIKRKTSTTRRVFSKGNLWSHNNLPRVKQNIL